jgi:hypothetical protein
MDESGYGTISFPPCGAGFVDDGLYVYPLGTYGCLDGVTVRSPDINVDGIVDLVDFSIFGEYFGTTVNESILDSRKSDLDADGDVDVIDFATFGLHLNHSSDDC